MDDSLVNLHTRDGEDRALVSKAVGGDRQALEELIHRHQSWIDNVALRMVWLPEDAEDVTQEILIKMLTRLVSFRGESSFRTWLYRILSNHVANMRRRRSERVFSSFAAYGASIDATPDMDPPDPEGLPVDAGLIVEEVRLSCMMGMILCLDRSHRLAFILGAMLGADAGTGSAIMSISSENFRQKLSRGRRKISQFMDEKCGLIRPENPCHCARKAQALILAGHISPGRLLFASGDTARIKEMARHELEVMDDEALARSEEFIRDQPFYRSPDFVRILRDTIDQIPFQRVLSYN
ncbi:RNA polymerase sigma factor [Candidatus Fermentibacteria bacterium]|nr:RNA polymerase sigma factor [Candidatus Fermentibacteria bacterium]